MKRVFVTGSTQGLGLAAARTLMDDGHQVVLHARSAESADALSSVAARAAGIVIGDLGSTEETRAVAQQINRIGRMDAVIHNAGTFGASRRGWTSREHSSILAVNTLAPYLLTALIERPGRLVYLSSSMHRGADGSLRDMEWIERRWDRECAYSESKLYVTALAFAVARHWPDVLSNAVDPGWVPTRMGGTNAPDDLVMGHQTQTWLAVSDDAAARVSGSYWYHRMPHAPASETLDPIFQDRLIERLSDLTGVSLF